MSVKARVIVAVVCGLLAAVMMVAYMSSVKDEAVGERDRALERYGGETVTVCVASRAIAAGEVFSERNVSELEWLVDLLPEGALAQADEVLGKTAACAIAQNTPLAAVHVAAVGQALGVPQGKVALSVPCSNDSAVGGELPAGSVVDVYVVGDGSARPAAQGIEVLKTNVTSGVGSLSWAILAVDPDQVEALVGLAATQKLYLTLPSGELAGTADGAGEVSEAEKAVAQGLMDAYGTREAAQQSAAADGVGVQQAQDEAASSASTGDVQVVEDAPAEASDAVEGA